MPSWFRRLADVPGVSYIGFSAADRERLPGYDAVPEIHTFSFEGEERKSLWWKTPDGGGSASPATRRKSVQKAKETTAQFILRQMREAVELPGELSDYHFAIQQTIAELWSCRTQEPWVLEAIEKLCELDLRLVAVGNTDFQREDGSLFTIYAYDRLLTLFEREGYIREALELAERAVRLGANPYVAEQLRQRVAILDEEDGV